MTVNDNSFGNKLVKEKIITYEQLEECIELQKQSEIEKSILYYLIEQGYVNDNNLNHIVEIQRDYFENFFNPNATSGLKQKKYYFFCFKCSKKFNIRKYKEDKVYFCPKCEGPLEKRIRKETQEDRIQKESEFDFSKELFEEESQKVDHIMDSIESIIFNEKSVDSLDPKKRRKKKRKKKKVNSEDLRPPRESMPTEISPPFMASEGGMIIKLDQKSILAAAGLLISCCIISFIIGYSSNSKSEPRLIQIEKLMQNARFTRDYEKYLIKLESLPPRNWIWWRCFGELQAMMGRYREAEASFLRSLAEKKNGYTYLLLGKTMQKLGKSETDCMKMFKNSMELEPSNKEALDLYMELSKNKK